MRFSLGLDQNVRTLLALLSLAGSGCVEDQKQPVPVAVLRPQEVRSAAPADPLVLVPSSSGGGQQALLVGQLVLERGCLYVVNTRGERWIPVFRSPGTTWSTVLQTIETSSGDKFQVGRAIRLAGGVSSPVSWVRPPAANCLGPSYWLVTEPFKLRSAT